MTDYINPADVRVGQQGPVEDHRRPIVGYIEESITRCTCQPEGTVDIIRDGGFRVPFPGDAAAWYRRDDPCLRVRLIEDTKPDLAPGILRRRQHSHFGSRTWRRWDRRALDRRGWHRRGRLRRLARPAAGAAGLADRRRPTGGSRVLRRLAHDARGRPEPMAALPLPRDARPPRRRPRRLPGREQAADRRSNPPR